MTEAAPPRPKRLVVAIAGASAPVYGIRLLEALRPIRAVETHLVLSKGAQRTIPLETDWSVKQVAEMASVVHDLEDVAASISSGSFKTAGMVVAPCSMNTLSGVATSRADNLITRAADVTLKERRKLVLLVRETPLHLGHIRNMLAAAEMGAIIFPPVPAFYHRPQSVDDIVNHTIGRILDIFEVEHDLFKPWTGPRSSTPAP
ncbi:MAG: UbiX family flavin prenyltransferase [Acidobacteria bacterium]|nr:UbiX family flavin prenyltransferase [Acidobacteriota bacterium]